MNKEIKRPYIHFLSNAANDVTGSCHLVRWKNYNILLDCGMIQFNDPYTSYKANQAQIKKIKIKEIDYIILSHCHQDHGGLIPALFAKGCHAHVYVPRGSIPILRILWQDSAKIMQSDCIKIQNKHNIKATPFYNNEDIERALDRCIEVDFGAKYYPNDDFCFTYYYANHIACSAQILLELINGSIIKRIGYTGDIGSPFIRRPYLHDFEKLPRCNYLIAECTYSAKSRNHTQKDRDKDIEKIVSVINQTIENCGKLLIPVFALDRLETMLTVLYDICIEHNINIPIIIDTPMGHKIANQWLDAIDYSKDIWETIYNWGNIRWVDEWTTSQAMQAKKEPMIILAASGMMSAGRSVSWAKSIIENSKNHILFCGYSTPDTLASKIKDHSNKYVTIDGETFKNKANITTLNSFSSHICHSELVDLYSNMDYDKIYLVHSQQDSKIEFAQELKEALSNQIKSSKVICTNADMKCYF